MLIKANSARVGVFDEPDVLVSHISATELEAAAAEVNEQDLDDLGGEDDNDDSAGEHEDE